MGQVSIVNPGGDDSIIGGIGSVGDGINSLASGTLQIIGSEIQGQTLQADVNLTDANTLGAFSYKWYRDNVEIMGATQSSYTLKQEDVDSKVTFSVEYTDGAGFFEKYTAAETGIIANVDDPTLGDLYLTGMSSVGHVVGSNTSFISDADGIQRFEYKWEAVDTLGGTATLVSEDREYILQVSDIGKLIRNTVTVFDQYGGSFSKTAISGTPVIDASIHTEDINAFRLNLSEKITHSDIDILSIEAVEIKLNHFSGTALQHSSSSNNIEHDKSIEIGIKDTSFPLLAENAFENFAQFSELTLNNGIVLDVIFIDYGKILDPAISNKYLTDLIIIPLSRNQAFDVTTSSFLENFLAETQSTASTAITLSKIGSEPWYRSDQQLNLERLIDQAQNFNSAYFKQVGTQQADTILGIDVANQIHGLGGSDTLLGGLGDDILVGGLDADTITTGGGSDLVVYEASGDIGDTITDFSTSDDKISVAQLMNANASSIAYADVIDLTANGSDTIVKMDPTGSGSFTVTVATLENILPNALGASNFDIDGSALSQTLSGSLSSSRKSAEFDGDPAHYPAAEVFAVSTDSSEDLFLRATSINDETIFEVVAKPSASIQSFDFTLTGSGGVTLGDFVVDTDLATDLGSSGTLTETSNTELSFTLTAASGSLAGATEHVLATFTATGQGTLTVSQGELGTTSIPTMAYNINKDTADASGNYDLSFGNGDALQLQAHADYVVPSTNPITPSDALEVLKTVVRINQSPTPEQLIAGDVDKDGKLTPSDALSILKKVVRMDGGVDPEWIFIDGAADYTSMGFTSVDYDDVIDVASITTATTINFEGILLGDFDGTL